MLMRPPMLVLAAALCAFTFFVHTVAGQRQVVRPMHAQMKDPFAAGTLFVAWHMVTWTLAVLSVALLVQPGWLIPTLCGGYALIFLTVSQRLFSSAIRLPQWILLGATALYAGVPSPTPVLLGAIALVHIGWALGFTWPEKSVEALALAIIGRKVLPSRTACLVVAATLAAMAFAMLTPSPAWVRVLIASIFLLRGTVGFVEPWLRREIVHTPYAAYSRYMYTPLALSIGIATLLSR